MNTKLIVSSFSPEEVGEFSDVESRLMHLGFVSGQHVRVLRKASLFKEPILVEVRGRSIALSFTEAELVKVKVTE